MHIDLWALGATLSEFFTPMMFATIDSTIVVDLDSLQHHENARLPTYNFGKVETPESVSSEDEMRSEWSFKSMRKGAVWTRQTIFDGGRGEIGLAGSIFKLRGTPAEDDWRVSTSFPFTMRYQDLCKYCSYRNWPMFQNDTRKCTLPHNRSDLTASCHLPTFGTTRKVALRARTIISSKGMHLRQQSHFCKDCFSFPHRNEQ